jgi:hypothetical protein
VSAKVRCRLAPDDGVATASKLLAMPTASVET